MKITVIGSGYVGLVAGTCLADLGNDVICVDNDVNKITRLQAGILPIYEPGLKDVLEINVKEGRLWFTTDIREGIEKSDVLFIAVGTPPGDNHEADVSAVLSIARAIGEYINGDKIVVDKSTVPVGTAHIVKRTILEAMKGHFQVDVVSNPEFLREGTALKDFMVPDRIIIGVDSPHSKEVMEKIYRGIVRAGKPLLVTSIESAELIKYASNAFLATKISFINEIARLCEKVGADVKQVALGMGLDDRIGARFLQAGVGYGGSCFPKDVNALIQTGNQYGTPFSILESVKTVNRRQRTIVVEKLQGIYPELAEKYIALWGLSFKPKTDDIRDAPSLDIISQLLKKGARVSAFDPVAQKNVQKIYPQITYGTDPYSILPGADAIILVTEWNEFRELDFSKVVSLMKKPILIDGRNIYDREEMVRYGFTYIGFGH
jgi:UDPglucose 6-dehydrogenase